MKIEKLFDRYSTDCHKLIEFMEREFSDFPVKCEEDIFILKDLVEEKSLEDWIEPFRTTNMNEVSKCLEDFIMKKSKKVIKKSR